MTIVILLDFKSDIIRPLNHVPPSLSTAPMEHIFKTNDLAILCLSMTRGDNHQQQWGVNDGCTGWLMMNN